MLFRSGGFVFLSRVQFVYRPVLRIAYWFVRLCLLFSYRWFLFLSLDAGTAESSTGMKHSTLQQLDGADWGETVVLKCDRVITHSTCMLFLHRVCNREELQSWRAVDDAVGAKAIRSRGSSPRQSPAEILRAPKTPPGAETLLQQVYIHVGSHTQNDKINWCFLQI